MLIMRVWFVLAVVVAAAASTGCWSYCDILYSGWKVSRRSDCKCHPLKNQQDGTKYEPDLKSILLPIKSMNGQSIFKKFHKNQENDKISGINIRAGETRRKIKRTSDDENFPVEINHNTSITSKSSDDVLNTYLSETNISDCIDLHILINIRKNKNKNVSSLKPNNKEKDEEPNDLEINTEIKRKCDRVATIIQRSVEEIKEQQKLNTKKNRNVAKIDTKSETEGPGGTTPVILTNDYIRTIGTDKTNSLYDNFDTDAITTDHTPILNSTTSNDFNYATTLEDNIREDTSEKYHNLKYINDTVEVITKDVSSNTEDVLSRNVLNTPITKLKDIQKYTYKNNNISYKLSELQRNKLNNDMLTEKSLHPVLYPERKQHGNISTVDYSDYVKESTSRIDQFMTNIDKEVDKNTIKLNEKNILLRDKYNETEVPVVKLITREYPNDTISSVINGTEMLSYSDFEEETIKTNNKTKNTSDYNIYKIIAPESKIQSRSNDTTPLSFKEKTFANKLPILNGSLYFFYGKNHIPGKFIQTPDGQLQLSLDLKTICNELSEQSSQDSFLTSTLCQCLS